MLDYPSKTYGASTYDDLILKAEAIDGKLWENIYNVETFGVHPFDLNGNFPPSIIIYGGNLPFGDVLRS